MTGIMRPGMSDYQSYWIFNNIGDTLMFLRNILIIQSSVSMCTTRYFIIYYRRVARRPSSVMKGQCNWENLDLNGIYQIHQSLHNSGVNVTVLTGNILNIQSLVGGKATRDRNLDCLRAVKSAQRTIRIQRNWKLLGFNEILMVS